jgi:glucose/arabinose dehydrogenase/mono/diheme cytochrome c family protein
MTKKRFLHLANHFLVAILLFLAACHSNTSSEHSDFPTDTVAIAKGQNIFNQNCIACHSLNQDGIGPPLGGLTAEVSADWLKNFIKDPKALIESGDERAQKLFVKYKTIMPSFAYYKDDEIQGVIAFLHTQKASEKKIVSAGNLKPLENPIPGGIVMSDLVVGVKLITQMPATSEQKPLTRITKFYSHPDTKELFVLDLRGKLYRLKNNQPSVYMDMAKLMPRFIDRPGHATGFGSFAFHPEFAKNGLLYTTHTEPAGSAKADFVYADSIRIALQWVLSEWKTEQPGAFPFSGTRRELLRVNMVNEVHGVQEIIFNPLAKPGDEDYGLLYIGVGDGGSAENGLLFLTKGPEMIWGSIIRIDPMARNSANGQYGIPPGNPFAKSTNPRALGEIYAYGFRNPHRITWSKSGQILASNIGQHQIEELNLILPGHDYGWPTREGTFRINLLESSRKLYPLSLGDANLDYPVAQYDHDEGNAIIGGFEYGGSAIPQLTGKYLFGDMVNGRLFYVDMADLKSGRQSLIKEWQISINGTRTSFKALCKDDRLSLRFGRDYQGEIYVSTMPDGKMYKLVSAEVSNK